MRAGELDVMRIEQPDSPELVLQRQRLTLELDAMVSVNLWPNISFCGRLDVGVSELEYDLGLADREPVLVGNAPPQDKSIVVEPVVWRIHKQDLTNLGGFIQEIILRETHIVLFGRSSHQLSEIEQTLPRCETVWSEDELATEIVQLVERKAVRILALLDLRDASHPGARRLLFRLS